MAATYLNVGGVLPVDEAIKDAAAFYPSTLEAGKLKGELYRVASFQNISTNIVNTTVFKAQASPSRKPGTRSARRRPRWPRRASPSWIMPAPPSKR